MLADIDEPLMTNVSIAGGPTQMWFPGAHSECGAISAAVPEARRSPTLLIPKQPVIVLPTSTATTTASPAAGESRTTFSSTLTHTSPLTPPGTVTTICLSLHDVCGACWVPM